MVKKRMDQSQLGSSWRTTSGKTRKASPGPPFTTWSTVTSLAWAMKPSTEKMMMEA